MNWIISTNSKIYDYNRSFEDNTFIDWVQKAKYNVGDLVYIYCAKPYSKIMYKCKIVKTNMKHNECFDDYEYWIDKSKFSKSQDGLYIRLQLLNTVDSEGLSLDKLKEHGLKGAPQGPVKVITELNDYIENCFNNNQDYYEETTNNDISYYEGKIVTVSVNKYERNPIARKKCLEYHGDSCLICGMNFKKVYGTIGDGFIHVHHLKPLYTIKEGYKVDYKTDLIPVCPNCHAMIHRIPNCESMSIDEIRAYLLIKDK